MSDCQQKKTPLNDLSRFRRDAVLGMMQKKGWIPSMESCWELDYCIGKAKEDLGKMPEIETLEDFVYHIDWIFCCEWDSSIQEWSEIDGVGWAKGEGNE